MSVLSGLRSIRGINWRRVLIQADFISGQIIGRWLTVTVTLIVVLHVVLLLMLGPSQATAADLTPLLFATSVIYALISGQVVSQMADEIGEGHAMLYLIHPLRRVEYLYAWLVAGPFLILLGYLFSLTVPLLVVDPFLLGYKPMYRLILVMTGQLLYHISLATLFSVISGRRGRATSMYLGFLIFLPLIIMLALMVVTAVLDIYPEMSSIATIFALIYPSVKYFESPLYSTFILLLLYEYGAALIIFLLALRTFTHRKEL